MTTLRMDKITVPRRMERLDRDHRGYPIPFIVMIDKTGRPQFTINNQRNVDTCMTFGLCSICGVKFDRHPTTFKPMMWFVGGSGCFLHERGAFLDPPMHIECATFALQVCPFLAAPSYAKRIDDRLLDPKAMPDDTALMMTETMPARQPDVFGLGMTHSYLIRGQFMKPKNWRYVEWWHNGEQVNAPDNGEPPPTHQ